MPGKPAVSVRRVHAEPANVRETPAEAEAQIEDWKSHTLLLKWLLP
jgi:hypothetical protein